MYTGINTKEAVMKILQEADDEKKDSACEKFVEQFTSDLLSDDEPPRRAGHYALRAYIINDVDEFCIALTGWSIRSILARAELIEDVEGVML